VWARKCPIPSGNIPAIVAKGKRTQTSDSSANLGFEEDNHYLAPHGMVGVDFVCLRFAPAVPANGPAVAGSSNQSGDCNARSARREWATDSQGLGSQRDIRQKLIEVDLVDCMVALPGQLFYSTQIPVCLWFLTRSKAADVKRGFRDRRKQTLFIDARKLGTRSSKLGPGKARPAFQSQLN